LILPTHTPGARYSKVTQGTISKTICVKGWTATIRPPAAYTNVLKKEQLAIWQYPDQSPSHYEEDHLISLELGGAPRSHKNLWPEPWPQARLDDKGIEARLHRQVCNGALTIRQAQKLELAYKHAHGWRKRSTQSAAEIPSRDRNGPARLRAVPVWPCLLASWSCQLVQAPSAAQKPATLPECPVSGVNTNAAPRARKSTRPALTKRLPSGSRTFSSGPSP
jgi:hypothetical protein